MWVDLFSGKTLVQGNHGGNGLDYLLDRMMKMCRGPILEEDQEIVFLLSNWGLVRVFCALSS